MTRKRKTRESKDQEDLFGTARRQLKDKRKKVGRKTFRRWGHARGAAVFAIDGGVTDDWGPTQRKTRAGSQELTGS